MINVAPPKPRYYQAEAVDALLEFVSSKPGNPLVAMPTGTGKSLVIGGFFYSALNRYRGTRGLMLTHSQELVKQNFNAVTTIDQFSPVGIYSAGLRKRETTFPITYGTVQSVANVIDNFGWQDFVVVDEAHLVSQKETTQYQKIFKTLSSVNPNLRVIGLSATIYRLGQGLLTEGGTFTDVCYDLTSFENFNRLVSEGYICPLVAKPMGTEYDLSNVRMLADDYNMAQVDNAINIHEITYKACAETIKYGIDRDSWLVFAVSVAHAEAIAETLRGFGINAVALHNKTKNRDVIISDFKSSKIQCLVANNMLTTGFDHAAIDLIAVMRPTTSTALWVQMLGRGTRPHANKDNCLVLDFARNTELLGPINDPVIPKAKGKKKAGGAPFKVCETCAFYNHTRARFCVNCGSEFPASVNYDETASHAPVMLTEKPSKLEKHIVNRVMYSRHQPIGKTTPTLRVNYICGFRMFTRWVPLEHPPPARNMAVKWWKERCALPPPDTVNAALGMCEHLTTPSEITVDMSNKKRPEIKHETFVREWQK